jgi:hypothetical protein
MKGNWREALEPFRSEITLCCKLLKTQVKFPHHFAGGAAKEKGIGLEEVSTGVRFSVLYLLDRFM